jgi:hypothetical protein
MAPPQSGTLQAVAGRPVKPATLTQLQWQAEVHTPTLVVLQPTSFPQYGPARARPTAVKLVLPAAVKTYCHTRPAQTEAAGLCCLHAYTSMGQHLLCRCTRQYQPQT